MANDFGRRDSARSSRSYGRYDGASERSINVFGDEFAVEDSGVADGFRPTFADTARQTTPRPTTPPRSSKPLASDENKEDTARNWGGTSQAMGPRNSFTLANDSTELPSRMSSVHQSDISRRISTVSTVSTAIPRTQSPFVGASAPSHPYGMYPQDTHLNRASTISSVRSPDRSYNGPSRPAHPYGMYPQAAADEPHVDPLAASTDIASVGFPGLAQGYARRLGPDGEDADDIIGPDGHTEQLPPYTRYPDAGPSKERQISPITEAFAPVPTTPSPNTDNSSSPELTGGNEISPNRQDPSNDTADESQGSKEKWMEKTKRRTCFGHMPLWAVVLALLALILIAGLVGGLIGKTVGSDASHDIAQPRPDSTTPADYPESTTVYVATLTTTLADAEPLTATPGNLPPLATGNFALPIVNASAGSSICLPNPDQQVAWACVEEGLMTFDVSIPEDGDADEGGSAQITLDTVPDIKVWGRRYGAQPPALDQPAAMELMQDTNKREYGPAYYFCQNYDKLVILPETALPSPTPSGSSEAKKRGKDVDKRGESYNGHLVPGDKPWYCWFNSTYLEGFIYVQQQSNSTSSDISSIVDELNHMATSTSTPPPSAAATSMQPVDTGVSRIKARHQANEAPSPHHRRRQVPAEGKEAASGSYTYTPIAIPSAPPTYPMAVKLEERRIDDSAIRPYCEQMQVLDDWSVNWITEEATGERITIALDEVPSAQKRAVYAELDNRLLPRDDDGTGNGCMCQWMSS